MKRPPVALGYRAHGAHAKAVVGPVALARDRETVVRESGHARVIVLHAHRHHPLEAADRERDGAALLVVDAADCLDGVVQCVAKERVDVRGRHEVERGAVGHHREHDALARAREALLGEDGVQGLVAGLHHRVVDVDLPGDVAEHRAIDRSPSVCEVADLMPDVMALDVDGLDVLAAEAVLTLSLGEQALGLHALVLRVLCVEQLVLRKQHEHADKRVHAAKEQQVVEGHALEREPLDDEVKAYDHDDHDGKHGEHEAVLDVEQTVECHASGEEDVSQEIDEGRHTNGDD